MGVRLPRSTAVAVLVAAVLMLAWGPQQNPAFGVAQMHEVGDDDTEPVEPLLTKEHLLDEEYMAEFGELFGGGFENMPEDHKVRAKISSRYSKDRESSDLHDGFRAERFEDDWNS